MVEKIYFDMDGVLADFDKGVFEFCNIPPVKQGDRRTEEEDDRMWEKIRDIENFYDRLDPMDGAITLFNRLYEKYGDKVEILTGIPKPRRKITTAGDDKISWAHRILSENLILNVVYRAEKKEYCKGKEFILIDDYKQNIDEWIENGGTGILFESAEKTTKILEEMGIL